MNSTHEKISGEQVWKRNGYFSDEKADLNIEKQNFPENALCYINQGYISTFKGSELAMYNHNHILGPLVVAANQPKDIDQYTPAKDEVKLAVCLYDISTGKFQGIAMRLAYIILRGDKEECFFSYGYSEKKSLVLYLAVKEKIPNAFISACFKKHFHEIMNKRRHSEEFSQLFFDLPSITDRKEKINQHRDNVNLSPIDCSLDYSNSFSPDKAVSFRPDLLNSPNKELRNPQVQILYRFFRQIAETSNANLARNVDHLCAVTQQDNSKISWIGPMKQRYDASKLKLTY